MNARVIKFDSLTDSVRTRTENNNRFPVASDKLGFIRITRIIVRRDCVKLGRASIHCLINRTDSVVPAKLANRVFSGVSQIAQMSNLNIRKSGRFGFPQQIGVQRFSLFYFHRSLMNFEHLTDEPRVDFCLLENLLFGRSSANRAHNLKISVFCGNMHIFEKLFYFRLIRNRTVP